MALGLTKCRENLGDNLTKGKALKKREIPSVLKMNPPEENRYGTWYNLHIIFSFFNTFFLYATSSSISKSLCEGGSRDSEDNEDYGGNNLEKGALKRYRRRAAQEAIKKTKRYYATLWRRWDCKSCVYLYESRGWEKIIHPKSGIRWLNVVSLLTNLLMLLCHQEILKFSKIKKMSCEIC